MALAPGQNTPRPSGTPVVRRVQALCDQGWPLFSSVFSDLAPKNTAKQGENGTSWPIQPAFAPDSALFRRLGPFLPHREERALRAESPVD
jgi:hypothetical protein